jgi:hypothetical protein
MIQLKQGGIMEMSQELNHSVDNTIKMADNLIIWAKVQMNEMDYVPKLIQIKKDAI